MSTQAANYFRLGNLLGSSNVDLEVDDNQAQGSTLQKAGTITIIADAFGYKVYQYIRNRRGSALAQRALVTKPAVVSATCTSSTTTALTTSSLTANVHIGKIAYVRSTSANAAPEGEASIVAANSATLINVEAAYPFSVASTTSNTVDLVSNFQGTASAAGDPRPNILGVVVGNGGITDGNFGWVQKEGPAMCTIGTSTLTVNVPAIAHTAAVQTASSSAAASTNIGMAMTTTAASQTVGLVYLNLFASAV